MVRFTRVARAWFPLALLGALGGTLACHFNQAPVQVPHLTLESSSRPYTEAQVASAVRAGFLAKGWSVLTDEPGVMTGRVSAGGHTATVRVRYGTGGWAI